MVKEKIEDKETAKSVKFTKFFNPDSGPVKIYDHKKEITILPGEIVEGEEYAKYWLSGQLVPFTKENVLSWAKRGSIGARYLMRSNPSLFTEQEFSEVKEGLKAKFMDLTMDQWFEALRDITKPPASELLGEDKVKWVNLARFLNVSIPKYSTKDDIYNAICSKYDRQIFPVEEKRVM